MSPAEKSIPEILSIILPLAQTDLHLRRASYRCADIFKCLTDALEVWNIFGQREEKEIQKQVYWRKEEQCYQMELVLNKKYPSTSDSKSTIPPK